MRAQPTPHQPHLFSSVDTLALWRMDETDDSDNLVDETGNYTTTGGSLPYVHPGLFTAPEGTSGARIFRGAENATAPGDAAAQSVLAPSTNGTGYTVELWWRATALTAGTFITYGGAMSGSLGTNRILAFGVDGDGDLTVEYQHGSGTTVSKSYKAGLTTDEVYHLALVVRRAASTIAVEVYVDGVLLDRETGLTPPAGGTSSPQWEIGDSLEGVIDDLRVSKFPASAACVRDSYARGIRRYDYATMIESGSWESHAWVYAQWSGATVGDERSLIDRGVGYIDLGDVFGHDHVVSVDFGEDADDQGMTATVRIRHQDHSQNLAPGWDFGAINDTNFLRYMQRIQIHQADVPDGYGRAGAKPYRESVFEGVVDKVSYPDNVMTITLKDRGAGLQKAWCKEDGSGNDRNFASSATPLETVLQQIVDAYKPSAGYKVTSDDQGDGRELVFAPAASGWNLFGFDVPASQHVLALLEEKVSQRGWRIRQKWDDHRKEFRLTVYEPNRTATWSSSTGHDLTTRAVLGWEQLEVDGNLIRNAVDVEYDDTSDLDEDGIPKRKTVSVSDATSISANGEQYCKVGVRSAPQLDTAAEATTLANNILADLKDAKAHGAAELFARFNVEIEDMVRVRAENQRFKVDTDFAVTGWRTTIEQGRRRTALQLRDGKPVGGWRRWLGMIQIRGLRPGKSRSTPTTPTNPALEAIEGGLRVTWDNPEGLKRMRRYKDTEIHVDTASGFTPSASTRKAKARGNTGIVKGLAPSTQHFVKLVHRDEMGRRSSASSQVSATPRWLPKVPGVKATLLADYLPGSGKTTLQLGVEADDAAGDYDTGTYTFTVSEEGFYAISASMHCTDTSSFNADLVVDVTRADGPNVQANDNITGTDSVAKVDVGVLYLREGDTVAASISKNSATANFRVQGGPAAETYLAVGYVQGRL